MRTLEDAYAVFQNPYATYDDMQAAQSFIQANESFAPVRSLIAPEEGYTYGDIVPLRTNQATGERELTVPTMAREGVQSLLNIAEGTQTGVVNPEDVMNVMPMGGAASLLDEGIEGGFAAGMFIARSNPAANKEAFESAEKMWNRGDNPRKIYQETGIYYGRDMQPRQEVSDAGQMDKEYLQSVLDVIEQRGQHVVDGSIKDIDIERLFPDANYRKMFFGNTPERVEMGDNSGKNTSIGTMSKSMGGDEPELGGYYNAGFDRLMINPVTSDLEGNTLMRPVDDIESIILHELQHGVQAKGLLEGGANDETAFQRYQRFVAQVGNTPELKVASDQRMKLGSIQKDLADTVMAEQAKYYEDLAGRDNIGRSAKYIFNSSEWYRVGRQIVDDLGPAPERSGEERNAWLRQAAKKLSDHYAGLVPDNKKELLDKPLSELKSDYRRLYRKAYPTDAFENRQIESAYNEITGAYDKLMDRTDRSIYPRYEAYRANLGEIEARATETRKDMPMDIRLGRYPEKDYTSLDKVWFSEPEGGFTGTGLLNIVRD